MAWCITLCLFLLLVPIILGMVGKLQMRWVLLWVAVLSLPVTLVIFVVLRGTKMDMGRIRRLYLPDVRRR